MPHIQIEYTANLAEALDCIALLQSTNAAIVGTGLFEAQENVKSRTVLLPNFRVGNLDDGEAFVHARIHLMAGRSVAERKQLGAAVAEAIRQALTATPDLRVQITVEVNEMLLETYQKVVIG